MSNQFARTTSTTKEWLRYVVRELGDRGGWYVQDSSLGYCTPVYDTRRLAETVCRGLNQQEKQR